MRRLVSKPLSKLVIEVTANSEVLISLEDENSSEQLDTYPLDTLATVDLRDQIGQFQHKADKVVLRLPVEQTLSKILYLPQAAEMNLRQVVGFEIDRLTPFSAQQLYYDVLVLERQLVERRIQIRFVAALRARVDPVLKQLAELGFQPDQVDVSGASSELNILPPEQRPKRGQTLRRFNWALVCLACLLLGLVSVLPLWQHRNLAIQLLPKVNAAQQEAEKILALRKELENAIESSGFLLQKRQNTPFIIDLLDELTRLFPDGAWVEQLEIKGNEIRVRGQSGEASALIERLEASKWFHGVTFLSPVTNDRRTGKDRFYLVAKIGREF